MLAEILGAIAARRIALAGEGVGAALRLALLRSAGQPLATLARFWLPTAVLALVVVPSAIATAAAWGTLGGALRGRGDATAIVVTVLLFVALWIAGRSSSPSSAPGGPPSGPSPRSPPRGRSGDRPTADRVIGGRAGRRQGCSSTARPRGLGPDGRCPMTTTTIECVECGETVPHGRFACPSCGALLAAVAGAPPPAVKIIESPAETAEPERDAPTLLSDRPKPVAGAPEPVAAAPVSGAPEPVAAATRSRAAKSVAAATATEPPPAAPAPTAPDAPEPVPAAAANTTEPSGQVGFLLEPAADAPPPSSYLLDPVADDHPRPTRRIRLGRRSWNRHRVLSPDRTAGVASPAWPERRSRHRSPVPTCRRTHRPRRRWPP